MNAEITIEDGIVNKYVILTEFDETLQEAAERQYKFQDKASKLTPFVPKVLGIKDRDIEMEYVEGKTLLKSLPSMNSEQIEKVRKDIYTMIDLFNSNDIYHQDLYPSNIILGKDGNTYVIDFALAQDHCIFHDDKAFFEEKLIECQ